MFFKISFDDSGDVKNRRHKQHCFTLSKQSGENIKYVTVSKV